MDELKSDVELRQTIKDLMAEYPPGLKIEFPAFVWAKVEARLRRVPFGHEADIITDVLEERNFAVFCSMFPGAFQDFDGFDTTAFTGARPTLRQYARHLLAACKGESWQACVEIHQAERCASYLFTAYSPAVIFERFNEDFSATAHCTYYLKQACARGLPALARIVAQYPEVLSSISARGRLSRSSARPSDIRP